MSAAATPALPLLPIAPLDGASGYIRWKESVLLRLRTLGMAYVLFDERLTCETAKTADRWARDDEICRGYILAMLSDRLLPVYAHHGTARAVWRAVACTYDLDMTLVSMDKFSEFQFAEDEPILEQLALLQALAASAKIEEPLLFDKVKKKLPSDLPKVVSLSFPHQCPSRCMDNIWEAGRVRAVVDMAEETRQCRSAQAQQTTDEQGGSSSDDSRCAKRRRRAEPWYNCGETGHTGRQCWA